MLDDRKHWTDPLRGSSPPAFQATAETLQTIAGGDDAVVPGQCAGPESLGSAGTSGYYGVPRDAAIPRAESASVVALAPFQEQPGDLRRIVIITGTEFRATGYHSGLVVTLGDAVIVPVYSNSTTIWAEVPAHVAGQVDVVVTNSDGQADRLAGAYTFASPQSFDFNGSWTSDDHDGPPVRFTIQNDGLAIVACGTSTTRTFSPPLAVSNGEFSFSSDDGVAFSGRIVSPSIARGTISLAPCIPMAWYAEKQ